MAISSNSEEFMKLILAMKGMRDQQWADMISDCKKKGYDIVQLWENGAPGFQEEYQQNQPQIIIYPAHSGKPTGSFIICAGGGFHYKSYNEAMPVADYFYEKGFHTVILDYRLIPYTRWDCVADGHRAIQYLRCHAEEYNIDPNHIVLGGFSAGGILSNMAGSTYKAADPESADELERYSSRPDAVIVGYGAFSDVLNVGVGLGFDFAQQREVARMSPDLLLHPDCPPRFLFQTVQDDPRNIANMQMRLAEMGIPFEAHLFQSGSHGQGLYDGKFDVEDVPHTAHWAELAVEWLKNLGFPSKEE